MNSEDTTPSEEHGDEDGINLLRNAATLVAAITLGCLADWFFGRVVGTIVGFITLAGVRALVSKGKNSSEHTK